MREHHIPLYGLESGDAITDFDFIGFTLQYELSYSNVLNMLDLAGIPLYAKDRKGLGRIVVAGGPCACNCEPLADFLDLVFLGEGEEVDREVIELYRDYPRQNRGGNFSGMYPGMPVLPGWLSLSSGAGKIPGNHRPSKPGALQEYRI